VNPRREVAFAAICKNHYAMTKDVYEKLSRLERQIMDAVYRLGEAPVADVVHEIGASDTSESVRVTMSNLEKKGFLAHRREGRHNLYRPTIPEHEARASLMDRVLRTFYDDSASTAILHLLDRGDTGLSAEDIAEIRDKIRNADRRRGGSAERDPG